MPFKFGGPDMPMSLRWTRSLVYSEAVLFVFSAIIYFSIPLLNSNNSSGVTSESTGSGSAALPIAGVLVALLLAYLAVDLRHTRNLTRIAIVVIQAVLLIYGVVTFLNSITSLVLIIALTAGTVVSLYTPASNLAFAEAAAGAGAKTTEPELPEELKKLFAEAAAKKEAEATGGEEVKEEAGNEPAPETKATGESESSES
jgi:hypothetical protein